MKTGIYRKLAFSNLKKNGKMYIPYVITCVLCIMMFYIMLAIATDTNTAGIDGGASLMQIMGLGTIVIGIFSVIFLFYTNSFLIKRRKKELGLYNILGMEKRHIAKMLLWESVFIAILTLVLGIVLGIAFSKLMIMILGKLIGMNILITLTINSFAIGCTIAVFVCIFLLTLLFNLIQIKLANPIALLNGGKQGEKEPKTKIIMTILGVLCLAVAYYIALTTTNPMDALVLFFLAVVLVIVGTFFLFIAGSIAILKALRKNKKIYYKSRNFTAISGMMYRMKQNAAGLANICILCTMVLVMLSTTVCLYSGVDETIEGQFARDSVISVSAVYDEQGNVIKDSTFDKDIKECVYKTATEQGLNVEALITYSYVDTFGIFKNSSYIDTENFMDVIENGNIIRCMSAKDYNAITGENLQLASNQVAVYIPNRETNKTLSFFGQDFTIAASADKIQSCIPQVWNATTYSCVVFDSESTINSLNIIKTPTSYNDNENKIKTDVAFNLPSATMAQQTEFTKAVTQSLQDTLAAKNQNTMLMCDSKGDYLTMYLPLYGCLLFLGGFLGILFLMATVLIIYYKQISEGYDDKERFEIMQKVGMSKQEVRRTIRKQVVMVFFIPLIMSVIHIAFAFSIITSILKVLGLMNVTLFLACTVIAVAVFAVIYTAVYALTARSYYKIVER